MSLLCECSHQWLLLWTIVNGVFFFVPLLLGDLDSMVDHSRMSSSATADATIEVDWYLSEVNLTRSEDPLVYWAQHKHLYPHLYQLALTFLCSPASSVPCERIFSKAGEVLSKKRNCLSPNTLEKILFLNKNNVWSFLHPPQTAVLQFVPLNPQSHKHNTALKLVTVQCTKHTRNNS